MQERNKRPHYSDQWGHASRGAANNFRETFGFKPVVFGAQLTIPRGEIEYQRRRTMKRITRDGKS